MNIVKALGIAIIAGLGLSITSVAQAACTGTAVAGALPICRKRPPACLNRVVKYATLGCVASINTQDIEPAIDDGRLATDQVDLIGGVPRLLPSVVPNSTCLLQALTREVAREVLWIATAQCSRILLTLPRDLVDIIPLLPFRDAAAAGVQHIDLPGRERVLHGDREI